ncbi:MAG: glycosyltransferase [Pseudomonadota bacterium]
MTRIAFLLPALHGGGAERVALSLMESFVAEGLEVDLVVAQAVGELVELVPREVRLFDLKCLQYRHALRPFARYLADRRPDAVQASMWPLTSIGIAAKWLSRTRPRFVVSEHIAISRECSGLGTLKRALARLSIAATYPQANARVAVSQGVADDLARFGGLSRDRIDVIYNPIPIPPRIEPDEDALSGWGTGTGPRLLHVGAFRRQKNHRLLLEAFARTVSPDSTLLLLGDGPLRAEIEADIRRLDLANRVVMPGFRSNPWPFYASADLLVLSSDFEGFGNVVAEAMAAGLRVISTDCPSGPAEILENGRYGWLVPCGDGKALAEAIDRGLAEEVPAGVRDRARDFSPQRAARAYLDLLLPGRL